MHPASRSLKGHDIGLASPAATMQPCHFNSQSGACLQMPQESRPEIFDAIVVGSGATGGWAAKQLSEAGLKVALLEAGRAVSPTEFTEHTPAYQLKYRDHSPEIARTRPIQKQC